MPESYPDVIPDVVRVGGGLVYTSLCVPEGVTPEDAAARYTAQDPPGTSLNEWVATPLDEIPDAFWDCYPEDVQQARTYPGPCGDHADRRHVLVNC